MSVVFGMQMVVGLLADVLPLPGGLGGVEGALVGLLVLLGGIDLADAAAVGVLYRLATDRFTIALNSTAALDSSVSVREILDRSALEKEYGPHDGGPRPSGRTREFLPHSRTTPD